MSDLIPCTWDGHGFTPRGNWHMAECRQRFGEGEIVTVSVENERSGISHRHQFAAIHDLWLTLPERLSHNAYAASSDTLRKHALIVTGYANCEQIVCGSKSAAERVGAYVGGLATKAHGYAIVEVDGPTVRCWTPHSQSRAAMGAKVFQASKTAVLEWIDGLLSEPEPKGYAA